MFAKYQVAAAAPAARLFAVIAGDRVIALESDADHYKVSYGLEVSRIEVALDAAVHPGQLASDVIPLA